MAPDLCPPALAGNKNTHGNNESQKIKHYARRLWNGARHSIANASPIRLPTAVAGRALPSCTQSVATPTIAKYPAAFIFLHRWRKTLESGFITRMFTAKLDGSDLHMVDPSGHTSHFIWRDPQHICAWTKPKGKKAAFYLFEDKTDIIEIVGDGVMALNGHNTYLPIGDAAWILNDTYPNRKRQQTPYLFHVPTRRRIDLGYFYLAPECQGEWRWDTHPRSSNDGRTVAIDSPHDGNGRQVWLLDVSDIVAG